MAVHLLRFESPEKEIGLTARSAPHSEMIGKWRILESLVPSRIDEYREKGLGIYKLVLECEVTTRDETSVAFDKAIELVKEVDTAWCYALGEPFRAAKLRFELMEAPDGWTGNLREVEREIQRQEAGMFAKMQAVSYNHIWLPCLPLKAALTARKAYLSAQPMIKDLIDLHVQSHKGADAQMFNLAKCLEIIGAFFSHRRARRNQGIENAMKRIGVDGEMTRSIEWLFNTGNERFDVRHAWDPTSGALHPRMSNQERRDYKSNADLVIRAFVCDQLNINIPIVGKGPPPKSGRWNGNILEFDP